MNRVCLNPYSTGSNSNFGVNTQVDAKSVLILILLEVTQIYNQGA